MKDKLEKILKTYAHEFNLQGVNLGILKNGKKEIVSMGLRDIKNNLPMEKDTIYAIGSQTKAFTAVALGKLLYENGYSFDTPIKQLYEDFKMEDDYLTKDLRIKDGFSHRTGFPPHLAAWYNNNFKKPQEFLKILAYLPATMPLRYTFCYQSYFFILGGLIIEKLSGKSYGDYLKENIFEPLQMNNTYVLGSFAPDENKARPYDFVDGTYKEISYNYEFTKFPNGSGTIYSTMEDMMKWLDFCLHGNEKIVDRKIQEELYSPQTIIGPDTNMPELSYSKNKTYGMGWYLENYRGRKLISHGGIVDGFRAFHILVPEEDMAVSIVTNLNEAQGTELITLSVIDEALGIKKDWQEKYIKDLKAINEKKSPKEDKLKDLKDEDFSKYLGIYRDKAYGEFEFIEEDGKLYVKAFSHKLEVKEIKGKKVIAFKPYNLFIPIEFEDCNLILYIDDRKIIIKK